MDTTMSQITFSVKTVQAAAALDTWMFWQYMRVSLNVCGNKGVWQQIFASNVFCNKFLQQ